MLHIETKQYPHGLALIISGRYDLSSVNQFEDAFQQLIEQAKNIVGINLKDLTYIDSSGIGSLIRCFNMARKKNITCYFYEMNSDIMTVFKLAKLDSFLKMITLEEFQLRVHDEI